MNYVLGIDAAWTAKEPSGITLLELHPENKPKIITMSRSYNEFLKLDIDSNIKASGTAPNVNEIIKLCQMNGYNVNCIALDLPLANKEIITRRKCDNLISSKYGSKGASTHSPIPGRPGIISEMIYNQLFELGYIHGCKDTIENTNTFIEVYPHTGIIEYLHLDYRLPYKVSKKNKYWKDSSKEERYINIISNLNYLHTKLSEKVENLEQFIEMLVPNNYYKIWYLKSIEDRLDSLICALIGGDYLKGNIVGYGDDTGTIWVPEVGHRKMETTGIIQNKF